MQLFSLGHPFKMFLLHQSKSTLSTSAHRAMPVNDDISVTPGPESNSVFLQHCPLEPFAARGGSTVVHGNSDAQALGGLPFLPVSSGPHALPHSKSELPTPTQLSSSPPFGEETLIVPYSTTVDRNSNHPQALDGPSSFLGSIDPHTLTNSNSELPTPTLIPPSTFEGETFTSTQSNTIDRNSDPQALDGPSSLLVSTDLPHSNSELPAPLLVSSPKQSQLLRYLYELIGIVLLLGLGIAINTTSMSSDHVIAAMLYNDIRLIEVLFPLSVTLLGFSLSSEDKSVARAISQWMSILAFWFCWISWCTTRWILNLLLVQRQDIEKNETIAIQRRTIRRRYLLAVHAPRTVAVLCAATAACAMIVGR
ncbi:hypothetical protein FRC03_005439 [Tulasnella sp. 419]|nr:hypothetical protein FRC03_005439 [Tulasnella sp. 419]